MRLRRLKRRCSRCLRESDRSPCPYCRAEFDRRRGSPAKRGYGTAWRRLRLVILKRDPYCTIGTHCDGLAPSTEVDHITPKREGGSDAPSNLAGVCARCHGAKTAREIGRASG